ncbi:CPBP family intramembrane metalloprotease [bacterium]|nr:CPBP family intramembrane metalloprotease [bacterium]
MNTADRKKLILFIALFSIFVTIIGFLAPLLGGSPTAMGPGFILWGAAPLLVALAMRLVSRDWSDAGLKPAFRKNAAWYLFVVIVCPILVAISLVTSSLLSSATLSEFAWLSYLRLVLPGFAVFFIFAIFEEFGWRGYLAPKLTSLGINPFLGYALTSIVWATWHIPYIQELSWVYSTENLITFLPRFYLYTFAYSILWNEIRMITGSVWPVVLLHGLTNAIQHPLAADFIKLAPSMEPIFSFNGIFMSALTGLLGIAIYYWRIKKDSQPKAL